MHTLEREYIRKLFQVACHGPGAEPRWEARHLIQKWLRHNEVTIKEAFEEAGLDLDTYFATRPTKS